jgi:leucyl aminopeptidase
MKIDINKNFFYTNKINKNIDTYIFIMCSEIKKEILSIQKLFKLEKFPKKMFNDIDIKSNFEKIFYTDKYEILFIGLNCKKDNCNNENLYNIFGNLGKKVFNSDKKIFIQLIGNDLNILKNQITSYILGFYKFNDLKTNKKNIKTETFFYHKNKKLEKDIENFIYEGITQNEIRSLINIPANILTSKTYSQYIKKNIAKDIKIKILNEKILKKIGCNLILGVNQGSSNKAMMIILEYKHNLNKNTKPIALIGKGVMFDSGGYNLKIDDFSDMKNDMTGSAIVYAIFKLLSRYKLDGHFIGFLPLVENMVDANAIRPGDILKSYSGKTVEIIDTDAEGRLIMADALSYSQNYNPYLCIDIATLTGQVSSIFGNKASVVMGNNNKYIQKMIHSGKDNNEKIWELPMWEEYVELTQSNIADLKNYTYEAKAGTIMAGAFLSNFIPKNVNWLHLDIAGTDNLASNTNMRSYGATGEILRTLFHFIKNFEKEAYHK